MSKPIELEIQCIKGFKYNNTGIPIVELIQDAYKETTGNDDLDLRFFDIYLHGNLVSEFDENTTLDDFLRTIQIKYLKSRNPNIITIRNKIEELRSTKNTNYSFPIVLTLKEKNNRPNKRSRADTDDENSADYDMENMFEDKPKTLPFSFSDGVEFIQYIMKQHVFDKLHDTVHSRCTSGNEVNSSFASLQPIDSKRLQTELCEIRKVLRSPLITIFTHFINSSQANIDMGKQIIEWIIGIFSIKSINVGNDENALIQNINDIINILDQDKTGNCGGMEDMIQVYEMKKIGKKEEIVNVLKGNLKSRISSSGAKNNTLVVDNAMAVKNQYKESTTDAISTEGLIDGAGKYTSGKYYYNATHNNGNELYTKCTPYEYHMYWEQDPKNFYQKIEIKLKRENGEVNGKIDVVITLCIGGNVSTSTIENYELFSKSSTRPAYANSEAIIDMITRRKSKQFNVSSYDSTQHFGKALGDFLKNMQFFSLVANEFIPFNENSIHSRDSVAIGATDRLASCIAIELGTESSYKVSDDTKIGKVIITSKGHISTIVTLFLENIQRITDTDNANVSSSSSSSLPSKSTYIVQGLSTISQILPPGFEINEPTNIKDNYSLFRSLKRSISTYDDTHVISSREIVLFKGELLSEISFQLSQPNIVNELKSILVDYAIEYKRREYKSAFVEDDYMGGFFEIQVFATLYNKTIIVHDYSDDIEVLHEFRPIESLFKPKSKIQEHRIIHLYYDGTHYSLLTSSNTNSGGGSRKYSKSSEPNIDLSTITDLDFVLWSNPLNREHLKRFENHKKAFNDFLLFLNDNHQNNIKKKMVITFIFDNKEYSFFTSTLHQALLVNQSLLKSVKNRNTTIISKNISKKKSQKGKRKSQRGHNIQNNVNLNTSNQKSQKGDKNQYRMSKTRKRPKNPHYADFSVINSSRF